jgi:hypothetical protein
MSEESSRVEQHEGVLDLGHVKTLEGKILTIIDATFVDDERRDHVKSLVSNAVWDWGVKRKDFADPEEINEVAKDDDTVHLSGENSESVMSVDDIPEK